MTSQICCFRVYHKINGIGKSICQNLWFVSLFFFFHCWRVGVTLEPCRCRVGETKKEEETALTPESRESYRFRCLIRVGHWHDAKNAVSVQPRFFIDQPAFFHCLVFWPTKHQKMEKTFSAQTNSALVYSLSAFPCSFSKILMLNFPPSALETLSGIFL